MRTLIILVFLNVFCLSASIAAEPLLDFGTDDYTLTAWVKAEPQGGPVFAVTPLDGKWRTGCHAFYLDEAGRMRVRMCGAGNSHSGSYFADGEWHLVAFPSFQVWRMYFDGNQKLTHIIDGIGQPGGAHSPIREKDYGCVFKIGQGASDFPNDGPPRQFRGLVDDVRIYNRKLGEDELEQLYQGKTEFPDTKLLAHWTFDEKNVKDATGNGNDLVPIGKPLFAPGCDGKGSYAELTPKQKEEAKKNPRNKPRAKALGAGEAGLAMKFDGTNALWLPLTESKLGPDGKVRVGKVYNKPLSSPKPPTYEPPYQEAEAKPKYGKALVKELGFRELLFVKRQTYHSSHFYSDFIDGCRHFGGNICVLDLQTGKVRDIFSGEWTKGIFGRVDLSFDAKKIVFGWKKEEREGFRIYEANIDGTGIRQITFRPDDEDARIAKYDQSSYLRFAKIYHHQTDDIHPCYLPDGGVIFSSSRCEYGTLCNSDDQLATAILYRTHETASKRPRIEKLTNSVVSEFTPSLAEDGRVIYTRWEYLDKGQIGVKCLWSMNSDGTATKEVYGNNVRMPPTCMQGRQIPGKPHKFVAIGCGHWPSGASGTVILIDTKKPIRTLEPMTYLTPYVKVLQEPTYNQYNFEKKHWERSSKGPLYRDPYPLSETRYVLSHNPYIDRDEKDATAFGLYIMDSLPGANPQDETTRTVHHRLLYRDAETSCWCPQPVRPRKKPPVTSVPHDPELMAKNLALVSVTNVTHGMENTKPGEVKWLRIMEQLPRPWASRRRWQPACGHTQIPGGGGPLSCKLLRGVVPVEKDGSAYFYVPADRNIYFEALNEDFLELQRERTYVNYRPGETRSCIGCHETPNDAPPKMTHQPLAMSKPPTMPLPQPGDKVAARPLHYAVDVQPTLDKYCVRCHGEEDPAAGLRLTGEDGWLSNTSASQLIKKGYVPGFEEGSDFGGTEYRPAKTIGSFRSKLMQQIKKGCPGDDKKMTQAEFVRIATWIDANGVYHGSYWGRIVPVHKGHKNYRPVPTLEESLSTVNPYEEWTPQWKYEPRK